jgi:Spy/CpxP family protein refolding chaperone
MKLNSILIALALGASTCLIQAQPDNQGPGGEGQRPGRRQGGGPGGPGGGGFHIIPPMAQDQLNLTDDQKKQIEALEKDTKAKLDTILTDEQKTKLKDMQERMRRRFSGQGGPGGPGGGQGGQGHPPGGKQRPPSDTQ